jgi:hypothetical protein
MLTIQNIDKIEQYSKKGCVNLKHLTFQKLDVEKCKFFLIQKRKNAQKILGGKISIFNQLQGACF